MIDWVDVWLILEHTSDIPLAAMPVPSISVNLTLANPSLGACSFHSLKMKFARTWLWRDVDHVFSPYNSLYSTLVKFICEILLTKLLRNVHSYLTYHTTSSLPTPDNPSYPMHAPTSLTNQRAPYSTPHPAPLNFPTSKRSKTLSPAHPSNLRQSTHSCNPTSSLLGNTPFLVCCSSSLVTLIQK